MLEPIRYLIDLKRIVLVSQSYKKIELLKSVGLKFKAMSPEEVDDLDSDDYDSVRDFVFESANQKILALKEFMEAKAIQPDVIIASEKVVLLNDEILRTPQTKEEARNMLYKLQGKEHCVMTGNIINVYGTNYRFVATTYVQMSPLTKEMINAYVNTGEPLKCPGGYCIDGAGATIIEGVVGEYTNVMGLPISQLCNELYLIFLDEKLKLDDYIKEKEKDSERKKLLFAPIKINDEDKKTT